MTNLKEINSTTSGIPFEDSHGSDFIIVACSDPRYRLHLNEFEKQLGGKIDRIILPGGPLGFTAKKYGLTDTSQGVMEWTELLAKAHHVKEIILMSHAGCAAYGNAMKVGGFEAGSIDDHQKEDLVEARKQIQAVLPEVKVRLFMEAPSENGEVVFTEFE